MDKTRAFYRAVHEFSLGTEALAASLGMSATTLRHKAKPEYPTQFFSPEEGIELQERTGDHGGLMVEAEALGYVLLKKPELDGREVCARAVNTTVAEFSKFLATVTEALADANITAHERNDVDARCVAALAAIQDLRACIAAQHEAAKPPHERGAA